LKKKKEKIIFFSIFKLIVFYIYLLTELLSAQIHTASNPADSLKLSSVNNHKEEILATIGDENILLGEYENEFLKTITDTDSLIKLTPESKLNFLNLYINYRIKVKDARERGILNDSVIAGDIKEFKKIILPQILIKRYLEETVIKQIYERSKYEVRASHIMLNLSPNPTPQDSINVYLTCDTIIQRLNNGEDFGELALQYSQDNFTRIYKGDLYYFTAGMTIKSFEDAVYNLNTGEFTLYPVRTEFGLHFVKLYEKHPRLKSVRVSHILIEYKRDSLGNITDSLRTYEHAKDIYNKAFTGTDWDSLVIEYSNDLFTKSKCGDIGYFDRRTMDRAFDSAAFSLKLNQISEPVATQYGWHIIKKTGEKQYGSYKEQKEELITNYKKSQAYAEDYRKYIEFIKQKFNFTLTSEGFDYLRSILDSSKMLQEYDLYKLIPESKNQLPIAYFADNINEVETIKLSDLLKYLDNNREFGYQKLSNNTLNNIINSVSENILLIQEAESSNIKDDPEFIEKIKSYENGILVYKIDQDEIWSNVKINETDIKTYFENNKKKFTIQDTSGKPFTKPFESVKSEIGNILQQMKFRDIESKYTEALKQKYPVAIYEEVLLKAFKN
jgi:peptidyl-prolyl cis-trans isomerase SurA